MIFMQSGIRNSKMKSQMLPFEQFRIFKLVLVILTLGHIGEQKPMLLSTYYRQSLCQI